MAEVKLSRIERIANAINAADFDGKSGLSRDEKLAVQVVADQYSVPNAYMRSVGQEVQQLDLPLLEREDEFCHQVRKDAESYYQMISQSPPKGKRQVVYIDFSAIEKIFEDKQIRGMSLKAFKRKVIKELQRYFTLDSRKRLNIHFTSEKPESGEYTKVVINPHDPIKSMEVAEQRPYLAVEIKQFMLNEREQEPNPEKQMLNNKF